MKVSLIIVTRNRPEELQRAVRSALAQKELDEILIYDDASSPPLEKEGVLNDHLIRIERSPNQQGYVVLRNRGFDEAIGDIIISMDDDAYFTTPETIQRIREAFDRYPNAATAALPYLEPRRGRRVEKKVQQITPGMTLRNYIGCACAWRKAAVQAVGGYRNVYVHQGDERDLALRMLARGQDVVFIDTPPLVHVPSAKRPPTLMARNGVRNTILFDWLNLPARVLLPRLLWDTWRLTVYGGWRELPQRFVYCMEGWFALCRHFRDRDPVSWRVYRTYLQRPGHGPAFMEEPLPPPVGCGIHPENLQ